MSIIEFGTGVLFGIPTAGNLPTNPTPFKFGILQEVSVDFKADLKKLYSTSQFPVAKARGKIEVALKGKFASYDPNMLNQLYFAQAATTGINILAVDEANTIPGTPYQVTVTHSANFVTNYGVVYAATGQQLIEVASSPTTGEYSVASGVYTFAAADTTLGVLISYTYSSASEGTTITLSNQLMGYAPELKVLLFNNFRTKNFALELNSVTLGSISIPTKQEDFWIADFDGDAGVDASNTLGKIYSDLA